MHLRDKAALLMFLAALNILGVFGWVATLSLPNAYLFAGLALPFGLLTYVTFLRCPGCRYPVFKKKSRIFGVEVVTWGGLPPPKCSNCGADL
jgi:hypothetical protein